MRKRRRRRRTAFERKGKEKSPHPSKKSFINNSDLIQTELNHNDIG